MGLRKGLTSCFGGYKQCAFTGISNRLVEEHWNKPEPVVLGGFSLQLDKRRGQAQMRRNSNGDETLWMSETGPSNRFAGAVMCRFCVGTDRYSHGCGDCAGSVGRCGPRRYCGGDQPCH